MAGAEGYGFLIPQVSGEIAAIREKMRAATCPAATGRRKILIEIEKSSGVCLLCANAPRFAWYEALPSGFELIHSRLDGSRRSASWYVHRLPANTGWQLDLSPDPVVSLEFAAVGAVERRVAGEPDRAELISDTLTLTPARAPCEWRWCGSPFAILDVHVPYELLQATWNELGKRDPATVNLRPHLKFDDPTLLLVMKSLCCSGQPESRASQLLYQAFTCHLIVCLLTQNDVLARDPCTSRGLPPRALRRVLEHIREHLEEELSLTSLAALAGFSSYHFLRQFRASTGMTPHQYVLSQRLDRARELLVRCQLTVLDVALKCGFDDASHFAECFRRRYKLTPSAFRRSLL